MSRTRRIDYPGAWHHVMHRGARRAPIFKDPYHCTLFFEYLERSARRFEMEIHAYVLMPNHFHLLVRSGRGHLSRFMQHLTGPYTLAVNRLHPGWDGPVFRGRFHNQLVDESEHLGVLVPYIHLNPVKARLVNRPEDALWTSYVHYIGLFPAPDFLCTAKILEMYGSVDNLVLETRGYRTGELKYPADFNVRRGLFRTRPESFEPQPEVMDAVIAERVARAKRVVRIITGEPWEAALLRRRGRTGNPVQRLAIHLLAEHTPLTQRQIGKELGLTSHQVGVSLQRIRAGRVSPPLTEWLARTLHWHPDDPDGELLAPHSD